MSGKTRRHSLVRIAVEKGTQSTKERFKEAEAKAFGWVLQMDMLVNANSSDQAKLMTYLKRMESGNYATVRPEKPHEISILLDRTGWSHRRR